MSDRHSEKVFPTLKLSSSLMLFFLFFEFFTFQSKAVENPRSSPVVKAVAEVLPSVVNIGTERIIASSYSPWGDFDPFDRGYKDFFAEQGQVKTFSLGSGAIIDEAGLVITNSHVVRRASKINVTLNNDEKFTAKVIAGDDMNDIALLRIEQAPGALKSFKPIKFSCPGELYLGEQVIAVGNPYGLGHSISCGVLSAIGRKATFQGRVIFSDILQTDAAINPGNSGGPLININAEMIGINLSMFKDAQGIGFAIPLRRIEATLAKWLVPERFRDVSLGIVPGLKQSLDAGRDLVVVEDVAEDSPAWRAGIRSGDQIVSFNSVKTPDIMLISSLLWKLKAGDRIKIATEKGEFDLEVQATAPLSGSELVLRRTGIGLQELSPQLAEAMDYPFEGGLIVNENRNQIKNIARGDMLLRLGDIPINNFEDIPRALQKVPYGEEIPAVFGSVIRRANKHYLLRKQVIIPVL